MEYVFMRYPDGKAKAATFSYDDGRVEDLRLVEIFDKYGVRGTFNLNSLSYRKNGLAKEQIRELFLKKGHEIAVHGEAHRANGSVSVIDGIRDVLNCRLELEDTFDRIIRGMAYPSTGVIALNNLVKYEDVKRYLTDLGIVYARTLNADNNSFTLPDDFHAWMPSIHHTNPDAMSYVDEFVELDLAYGKIHKLKRHPRLLYIWGHAHEFSTDNNWDLMEQICEKLTADKDIWFATNIEIYDYVTAYKSLVYSADGYRVYNPTAIKVWIDVDGTLYSINPGQTIKIEEKNI